MTILSPSLFLRQGCGIVTFKTHESATKALNSLDNSHTFEGMNFAMVLKWVDQDLQKRRKADHDGFRGGSGGSGNGPSSNYGAIHVITIEGGSDAACHAISIGADRSNLKVAKLLE